MKLTDEEIAEQTQQCEGHWTPDWLIGFHRGARFAESRYLPLVEAQEWLLIDTSEKKKACYPAQWSDECFQYNGNDWKPIGEFRNGGVFHQNNIYRRRIQWHAVNDTPIPKGVPVWLKFEHSERPLVHATGGIMSHESWGPITHWRYAVIPEPPKIDKEREAFEKWFKSLNERPTGEDAIELLLKCWQAARKERG